MGSHRRVFLFRIASGDSARKDARVKPGHDGDWSALTFIMAGLDPAIFASDGARDDPRVKPGDDELWGHS
jgi:hypothetical protein